LIEALGGERDHARAGAAERHAEQSGHARQRQHVGETGNQRLGEADFPRTGLRRR
jgi:hypothetical protein